MIRKERLPNGLLLLTESMPQVRSVSIGIWLKLGSRNEPARLNGISHFIEHLVFKGTDTRSARQIALALDSVGGQMDAFTSKEYTCFYAKVLDEHLNATVELLADIVQHPRFDPTELERERQVVLEEIRMVEDTPDDLIYDLFSSHFYPGNALGRPIQGTAETVGAMSRRQLLNFFHGAYRPENMLIVASGRLSHAKLSRVVRKAFRGLRRGTPRNGKPTRPRTHYGLVTRRKPGLEQLHVLMGLPTRASDMQARYPMYVFNALLGGTMSSRLFQRIREERGLAYNVYSAVNAFADTGFLNIYAASSPSQGKAVVGLIVEVLEELRDKGPTQEELDVAKEHLKGSLMLGLESTSSRMSNLARHEIYFGRQLTLGETLRGVNAVTCRQVHELARDHLENQRLSIAAVGKTGRLGIGKEGLTL